MTPNPFGHDAVLYVRDYAPPGDVAYFTSRLHGALWVGNVPVHPTTERVLGLITRPLGDLARDLEAWRDRDAVVLTGFDAGVDALLPARASPDSVRCSTNCDWSRTTGRSPDSSTPATPPPADSPMSFASCPTRA